MLTRFYIVVALFLFLISCDKNQVYFKEIKIENSSWAYQDSIVFSWEMKDTTSAFDLLLHMHHNADMKYQNVYLNVKTTNPDQSEISNLLSLELFQPNGKSNGDCSRNQCEALIPLQENISFPQMGNYSLTLFQNSRDSLITGIQSIALELRRKK
ncbi:MAG: gliding motility lipoprotein GldH [Saprospiraceae bacterium]